MSACFHIAGVTCQNCFRGAYGATHTSVRIETPVYSGSPAESRIAELEAENARMKRIIAKELSENDELGSEFANVVALKEQLAAMTRERDDLLKASKYWSSQLEASMRDLSEDQKERDRYRQALATIQFLGAKGTSRIWPDRVLEECVGVATKALKERE